MDRVGESPLPLDGRPEPKLTVSHRLARAATRVLILALALAGGASGFAADARFDVMLGDEIEADIDALAVYAYRLPLVAGTSLDLELEAESSEGDDSDDGDAAGKSSGPAPALALLDPGGVQLAAAADGRRRIRTTVTETGTYVVEVRAGSFSGSFSLEIDGELPRSVGGQVDTSGSTADAHLDAPVGASVRIDVRRVSGDSPQILAVRDGTGRDIGFTVKRSSASRVLTRPVPVTAPGGLTVVVGGSGTYDVRGRLESDDDDLPEGDDDRDERRIVVTLAPGADAAAIAAQLGYRLVRVEDGIAVFETPVGREGLEDEDARRAGDTVPEVLGAEVDARLQTPEGLQSNGVVLGSSLGRTDFGGQAALDTIRATRARRKATGRGIVVAVVDTGIDAAHPLFAGRLAPGYDFVGNDADPAEETNGIDDDLDGDVDEGYGHGTFVAGLVLAVAPDATILPVRVLDTDAVGTVSRVAAGIRYAVEQGVDVINLSLGARVRSEVLRGEVRRALSRGIKVVAATGNRADVARIDFPAGLANVVAVSALDARLGRADFANAGAPTTMAAPGTDLIGPYPGGTYAVWSGTSFSAALGTGAIALLVERRPRLRPAQIVKRLKRASRTLPRRIPTARRAGLGGGRLDLARLVR